MPDRKSRGVSNLPVAVPDVPDTPSAVTGVDVGTGRAFNNGAAVVSITSATGGRPTSYSITTTPTTSTTVTSSNPVTITGLSSATSYTVTATATNSSGVTTAARTSSAFTATTVPQAPTIGTFTDGGTGTTGTLSFTAGATGGSAITAYKYSTDGSTYTTASGTTSPLSITGLTPATYTFTLKAANANGDSAASSGVSGTVNYPPSFESIATITATSNGVGQLSFTNIPQTYSSLHIRGNWKDISTTDYAPTAAYLQMAINGAGSVGTWVTHYLVGNGATASSGAVTSMQVFSLVGSYMSSNATYANMWSSGYIDIHDYASTTKNKTFKALWGADANGNGTTNRAVSLVSGLTVQTVAITGIDLYPAAAGFATGSTFTLYGVK